MSCSRCLYLSALLASVFVSPAAALNSTMVLSDNDFTLKYTHTNTPIPKPASSFADMSRSYKTAGVCFLGVGDCGGAAGYDSSSSGAGSANDDFYIDTSNQCLNEGFVRQNCNSVQTIDGVCPYNSAYGLGCKCLPDLISCPAGQVGVGESCDEMYASCECDPALVACSAKENGTGAECGGRYESCVCKPEYQYTSSNCSYPRSVSGDSCGGQYTDCVCPAGVDEGQYGCAEYYPSPCSSVCKVAYSDNCHIRSDDPNTALGYGCMKEWDDCSTKCERAYTDMCRERTAVISSCPDNADCSYFSDCSSKISSWFCKSGYKQEGSSCVVADPCGSYYKCDGTYQYCAGTTCPQDSSKCSVYCPDNMYPYRCFDSSLCGGKYKYQYCSVACPSCVSWRDNLESIDYIGGPNDPVYNGTCKYEFSNGVSLEEYVNIRPSSDPYSDLTDYCRSTCADY